MPHHRTVSFASDNVSGAHPAVLAALQTANTDHVAPYGNDPLTKRAEAAFCELFGCKVEVFFVFTGTAANVLSLSSLLWPHQAVICSEQAHINVDECGAPERFGGMKLLTLPSSDGRITPEGITHYLGQVGNEHRVQPKVVSITQATECGVVLTPSEISAIGHVCQAHNLHLHMDGARFANAVASLGVSPASITVEAGVDVLSFGGTKNGLLFGEAVVFFNTELARHFKYIRKQGMQLASKNRFLAAQFLALLENDLWLENARHSNAMAALLATLAADIPGVRITQTPQANAVFAVIPPDVTTALSAEFPFYVWDADTHEVRWMTSFDTTEDDVRRFTRRLATLMADQAANP
ncbi:threonine aldolase family protein [Desulfovibrio inopinatus]|uniref:threonine aldolase family protein n=1 Tax=Desulfovibrio inopinatus TaxID=102109 RepID=UPI00041ADF11|nr:low specificity L-threonine aldolase [Desulfovibrio inopinatus]